MPIYEFTCQSCGNEFEQIRSFSDSSVPTCTKCGSAEVVRRVGRPAIHFKGSGWYITDSKKGGKNGDSKGAAVKSSDETTGAAVESKSESSSEGKTESKTESKVESKSESKPETKSASAPAPVASD